MLTNETLSFELILYRALASGSGISMQDLSLLISLEWEVVEIRSVPIFLRNQPPHCIWMTIYWKHFNSWSPWIHLVGFSTQSWIVVHAMVANNMLY